MKVLLDEDVPHKLIRFLQQHSVETVVSMRWGGVKNGALLSLVERAGFDVFITGDKSMESQQRLTGRPFAVLVLSAINWPVLEPSREDREDRQRCKSGKPGQGRLRVFHALKAIWRSPCVPGRPALDMALDEPDN